MKFFTYLLALLISYSAFGQISKSTLYHQQDFDVISYDVHLDLSKAPAKEMTGYCEIKFAWTSDIPESKFYFHLNDLEIDSAFYYDNQVFPTLSSELADGDSYYILSRAGDNGSDTVLLRIYYSGVMTSYPNNSGWAGVVSAKNILYSMGVGFSNPAVSSARYWMPCYDHPSDKALINLNILVSDTMKVASNGLYQVSQVGAGKHLYSYRHEYPIATYLANFAVGKYNVYNSNAGEVPIDVFYLPKDSVATNYYYKKVPEMVAAFEKYFGEYPFEKVGYVNTPSGSMEHQTMVSMDESLIQQSIARKDSVASTAAHELAHQWFGNMLSPLDFREAWLNEGFATYCEALWKDHLFGKKAYMKEIYKYVDITRTGIQSEGNLSLYDFDRNKKTSNYPTTIYYKGAAVLSLLRYEIGDDAFFKAINEYIQSNKYGNVTTEKLKSSFKANTDYNIDVFFDEWIYSKGIPVLEVIFDREFHLGAKLAHVKVKQVQADSIPIFTNFPLVISFTDYNNEVTEITLRITSKEQDFELKDIPRTNAIDINYGKNVCVPLKVNLIDYLSVGDVKAKKAFISPNPAFDYFKLHYKPIHLDARLTLIDIKGRVLYQSKLDETGINTVKISNYPNGKYIVKIEDGKETISESLRIAR